MSARSARLSAVGFLLCIALPLTSISAEAPQPKPTRLESLLVAHDVRYAIHAHTQAERGR
jgi:hypothetical protein